MLFVEKVDKHLDGIDNFFFFKGKSILKSESGKELQRLNYVVYRERLVVNIRYK